MAETRKKCVGRRRALQVAAAASAAFEPRSLSVRPISIRDTILDVPRFAIGKKIRSGIHTYTYRARRSESRPTPKLQSRKNLLHRRRNLARKRDNLPAGVMDCGTYIRTPRTPLRRETKIEMNGGGEKASFQIATPQLFMKRGFLK